MVLKSPFFSDTGEDPALHIHCSDLPGDRASIRKIALKGTLVSDTGEVLCIFIIQVSWETELSQLIQ